MNRTKVAGTLACFVLTATLSAQVQIIHNPCEKGKLIDGNLVGIWEYSDREGETSLAVDYDNKRLVSIVKDTNDYHYFKDGIWQHGTLEIPARFLGSTEILVHHYMTSIKYPFKAEQKKIEGIVQLVFEVDTDGIAKSPKVIPELGGGITETILEAFDRAPNFWVVGSIGGRAVPCRFKLIFQFCYRGCDNQKINEVPATTLYDSRKRKLRTIIGVQEYLMGFGHPKPSPDGKKIAFTRVVNNSTQICIFDLEDGDYEVVPFQANLRSFEWSTNSEICFDYDFLRFRPAIAKYSTDIKEVTVLYQSASSPIVSPDNKMLFIQNYDETSRRIMVSDLNRPDRLPVGAGLPANIRPVSWSPDGAKILYLDTDQTIYSFDFLNKEHTIVPLLNIFYHMWSGSNTLLVAQDFTKPKIFEVDMRSLRYSKVDINDRGLVKIYSLGPSTFLTYSNQQIIRHHKNGSKETILKNVIAPFLSQNKVKLSYIDAKEKQIKVFDLETGENQAISLN